MNVDLYLEWMLNSKRYQDRRYEAYENTFSEFNLELTVLNINLRHECQEFLGYYRSKAMALCKLY